MNFDDKTRAKIAELHAKGYAVGKSEKTLRRERREAAKSGTDHKSPTPTTQAAGRLLGRVIKLTDGSALREALAEYEATGDHDHGFGPIAPGAPCKGFCGDECWVKRARSALALLEAAGAT